jgi:TonB family protein
MLMSSTYAQETRFYDLFFSKRENKKTENVRKFFTENESVRVEEYKGDVLQNKITVFGLTKTDEIDEFVFYCRSRGSEFYYKPYFKRAGALLESYEKELLRSRITVEDNHFLYIQIWDENGNPLLTNGSGYSVMQTPDKDEDVYTYYKDSLLVVNYGIRKEQRDTIYYTFDEMAAPKNGIQGFYKDLIKALKYPGIARLVGKEGMVYVQFVVDEKGKLKDFKPLTSEGFRFESKTIKKLEASPNWNPSVYKKRFVQNKFVLPVKFELLN